MYNMLMKINKSKLQADEQGFASIVIAIVLILILSLITVGFAQLMQREQREALDKQLSSQAYYAAESGINDATQAINAGFFQTNPTAKTTCGPITNGPGSAYFSSNAIGTNTGASYPCLTVNPTPLDLQYGSIGTVASKVFEMQGINPADDVTPVNISTIELSWQDAGGSTSFAGNCNAFYPAAAPSGTTWNFTGLLRAELIPINDLSRTGLINNTYTGFLCPNQASAPGTLGASDYSSNLGNNSGTIVTGNCNASNPSNSPQTSPPAKTPLYCNAEITGLGGLDESTFFLALRSIYSPTTVTVTAYDSGGSQLAITDAQTLVDSTGKAQDVLRRIQARIPTYNNYDYASFDLESTGSICKQLQLTPSSNDGPVCP